MVILAVGGPGPSGIEWKGGYEENRSEGKNSLLNYNIHLLSDNTVIVYKNAELFKHRIDVGVHLRLATFVHNY